MKMVAVDHEVLGAQQPAVTELTRGPSIAENSAGLQTQQLGTSRCAGCVSFEGHCCSAA